MQNLKDRLKSLRARISVIIVCFSALTALFTGILSFSISRRYLVESERQSAYINLQLLGNEINSELDSVLSFSGQLSLSSEIETYLRKIGDYDDASGVNPKKFSVDIWENLNEEYRNSPAHELIARFIISTPDGEHFLHIARVQNGTTMNIPESIMAAPFFKELVEDDGYRYIGLARSPISRSESSLILPIVRPFKGFSRSDMLGWIYIEASPEIITKHIDNIKLPTDSELYLSFGETTYRYSDGDFSESSLPSGLVTYSLPDKDLSISLLPSKSELRSRSVFYALIVLAVSGLIILTGMVIYILLRKMINEPIEALLLKLRKTGNGDFSRDPSIEWDNELGGIGRGINDLSASVNDLIKERVSDERKRQDLEYRILQSQVNPHFMYNTLNTIKWMATIQGADGIADMSTALSRLLKNVSKVEDQLIPLKDELALLDDYFTIMKYRYGGTIELSYEIEDDGLLTCMVNRFSLQPIVENSIFHGIEPKGSAGRITIRVFSDGKLLFIDVKDNGIGMSEEELSKLFEERSSTDDFFKDVGIKNVHSRIQYSFGQDFGLTAESREGEYTIIHYVFPREV